MRQGVAPRAARRIVPRSWPSRLAVASAVFATALDGFALAPWSDGCRTGASVTGDCATPSALSVLLELAVVAIVVFYTVFGAALILRAIARQASAGRRREGSSTTRATDTGEATEASIEYLRGLPDEAWAPPDRPAGRKRRAAGLVLVAVMIFGAGVGVERAGLLGGPADAPEFGLIREAWDLLHREYVRAAYLDSTELAHAAIGAMTEAVGDTGHTWFYPPEDALALEEELRPTTVGIGAELDTSGNVPVVVSVAAGGPAERAGLQRGDRVMVLAGSPTRGVSGSVLSARMRGEAGSVLTMTVKRRGSPRNLTLAIEREELPLSIVEWAMVPATRIALIWLPEFAEGVSDDLASILVEVRAAKARGIVLDLRGNPGGLVDEAIGTASTLLASGLVMQQRVADGTTTEVPVAGDPVDTTTPLVVLVDGDSASAAEILASALRDAGRATLVGVTTFGTGTGLADFPLQDGSLLSIGVAEWLTAGGRSVWRLGLRPDTVVRLRGGVAPVRPADLAALGKRGLERSGDAQLLAALQQLEDG